MARPKILVFQHLSHETLGTLDPLLEQAVFADSQLDPILIRDRINDAIHPFMALSNNTFSRWTERFDLQPRIRQLPSR